MANNNINLKHRAYYFSLETIDLVSKLPNHRAYWVIQDQLLRSATSVGANIVEAKSSSSKKDFAKFYDIALKSANETKYWLCLLRDGTDYGKENKPRINQDLNEIEQISNMLASSLLTMKNKKKY
ncbi:MAG: four helix bundle protein [Candidatus Moranbacteria bacterium]|nr:four helix bundle protein [Candidatus Moranbacteria bacterium]